MRGRKLSTTTVLAIIVLAQFAGTSLWFAGNAILPDLREVYGFNETALGHITASVQFGFIIGTLVFASLTIADRFSPSKVFLVCAVLGAVFNLSIVFIPVSPVNVFIFRFLTGFTLAGIYPVGMKIAADYHEKGLGKALGYLLGALVLGTAFPHFLRSQATIFPWEYVVWTVSGMAALGGLAVYLFVPDGPFRKPGSAPDLTAVYKLFRIKDFRAAAFGYFGHMWEIYAFWAFVPILISYGLSGHQDQTTVSFLSFVVIAIGMLSCILGGYLSGRSGSARVAFGALAISGLCCLLSPLALFSQSGLVVMALLIAWGLAVVADSPQFSTLVATSVPAELRGSGLTIVNSVGFAITIVSIQLLNYLFLFIEIQYLFLFLAPGPVLGLLALRRHGEMDGR